MAFVVKTLADIKQSLADRHDSGVLPTDSATLSYWVRLLNRGKDYCAESIRLEKSLSIAISSGTYTLPTNFILIDRVVNSAGVEVQQMPKDSSVNLGGLRWWITGSQEDGFTLNMPSGNDGTYTLFYTYRPVDMSLDADKCVIPDSEAVVAFAYGSLRMSETDPLDDADKSFGECERRISEMIDQKQINDQELGFSMPSDNTPSTTWDKP